MTRLQLRRLALQATRRPELLPVLQDALLESALAPRFEEAVGEARELAAQNPGQCYGVIFALRPDPDRPAPFYVYRFRPDFDFNPANRESLIRRVLRRGHVPVFFAQTKGPRRRGWAT